MLLHGVAEPSGSAGERLFEGRIRERLDPAAVVADEVVMVLVLAAERLEPRDPVADVDALDEPQVGERVERPVDACDADRTTLRDDAVVDLLRRAAAILPFEEVDDRAASAAATQTRVPQGGHRVLRPAHGVDDIDSPRLVASAGDAF